jgi:DNA-binding cell septation regulator SpoVG
MIGFATITLDDVIRIESIIVFNNEGELSFSMPRKRDKEGDYHDQIFVLKDDLKKDILAALEEAVDFNKSKKQEPFDSGKPDSDSDLPF